MLKSGDVMVMDEKQLEAIALGEVVGDVRKGKASARKLIEDSDDARDLVVVRVERVARGTPVKPRFVAAFDDEDAAPVAPVAAATPSEG